jgi:hypothetical protein
MTTWTSNNKLVLFTSFIDKNSHSPCTLEPKESKQDELV